MPIRVTCDECRGAFDAPDDDADGLAPCPACGAACLVPVPGALPPLRAEAIEPDEAAAPPKPSASTALYAAKNPWIVFGRGCVLLKWAVVLGSLGTFLAVALSLAALTSRPKQQRDPQFAPPFVQQDAPARSGLVLGLASASVMCFASSGLLGAIGRSMAARVPERCGAGAVLGTAAVLAWLRAVLLGLAVVLVFGVTLEGRNGADLAVIACACVALGAVFGAVAELSALPALVAVGAAMPSTGLRGAALSTTLVLQIAACLGALAPLALIATAPLQGGRGGGEELEPLTVPLLGASVVFELVYAMALFALYDAGATAGASGGDRPLQ